MPDNNSYPYNLPVSFHFRVEFLAKVANEKDNENKQFKEYKKEGTKNDSKFQEVGGLTAEMGVEELTVGGENRFSYRLPTRAKYNNLVLKRGVITDSELIEWFRKAVQNFEFEPRDLLVELLNEKDEPVAYWSFVQAYPVKWVISDFNANGNSLVIETIELAYQYFQRKQV